MQICHNTRKTNPWVKAKVAIGRCLSYIRTGNQSKQLLAENFHNEVDRWFVIDDLSQSLYLKIFKASFFNFPPLLSLRIHNVTITRAAVSLSLLSALLFYLNSHELQILKKEHTFYFEKD